MGPAGSRRQGSAVHLTVGDVFLESADGTWWFLDTFEGQFVRGWNSRADLTADLDTEGGQDRYLLATLAMAAYHRRGLHLDAGQLHEQLQNNPS